MLVCFLLFGLLPILMQATRFHIPCNTNEYCVESMTCRYLCDEGHCSHEPLLPLDYYKAIGCIAIVIVAAFANAGGIGGGAIIVPIYIYMFDYTIGEAIPMSKATILAGAIVNIFVIINQRHPNNSNALLIDMKLSSLIVPLILAGTMIGVILTRVLPPLIILLVMIAYLTVTTHSMYRKARHMRLCEWEQLQCSEHKSADSQSTTIMDISTGQANLTQPGEQVKSIQAAMGLQDRMLSFWDLVSRQKANVITCILGYFTILAVALMRGGEGMGSVFGFGQCSAESWTLLVIAQLICLGLAVNIYMNDKQLFEVNPLPDKTTDIGSQLISLGSNAYLCGIISGTLGMGGGIVINPVLIRIGLRPEVAAALSGFVVFFTSSSTTSQFLIAGAFDYRNAMIVLTLSAIGSFIGSYGIGKLIRRSKRPSLLLFILFWLLLASLVSLPLVAVLKMLQSPSIMEFNSPC